MNLVTALDLAGNALGALGGVLLFFEFFQLPSYVEYSADFGSYDIDISPMEAAEYTWVGRAGAFLVAVAFSIQFLVVFL